MNVIIAKQKFLANLIYLSFSKFSYISSKYVLKEKLKILSPNVPKSTQFLLKNRKNHPVLDVIICSTWYCNQINRTLITVPRTANYNVILYA